MSTGRFSSPVSALVAGSVVWKLMAKLPFEPAGRLMPQLASGALLVLIMVAKMVAALLTCTDRPPGRMAAASGDGVVTKLPSETGCVPIGTGLETAPLETLTDDTAPSLKSATRTRVPSGVIETPIGPAPTPTEGAPDTVLFAVEMAETVPLPFET